MQWRLILIWHKNSLACLHVFLSVLRSVGQQASEDWQLSQAEVYWPACWWLGLRAITDTKPLFPASKTPQLRVDTLCSQRLSMWTLYLHSLCVKKAKAHYQDSRAQAAFWSFEDTAITSELQTWACTFPFYSNHAQTFSHLAASHKTRGDCCTLLWWWLRCISWPLFLCCFCSLKTKRPTQVSKSYYRGSKTNSSLCKPVSSKLSVSNL